MTNDHAGLQKKIGIVFKNKNLLCEALTHRSYLNENAEWPSPHNERLEFLGDAVLELIITDFLFRKYPERQEGELTSIRAALVNHVMLSRVAQEIGLEEHIYLSRGEAKDSGRARDSILANAVEALLGAAYIDGGYDNAKRIVEARILVHLDEVIEQELFVDSKSLLQEIVQEKLRLTPTYQILDEVGPDHKKEFVAGVFFGDELIEKGAGPSKQEAERAAAAAALKKMESRS